MLIPCLKLPDMHNCMAQNYDGENIDAFQANNFFDGF